MNVNCILLSINAFICAVISIRLITFKRGKREYNRIMAFIAWLLTIASGTVTIRVIFGEYFYTDWSETLINIVIGLALLRSRGDVGCLIKGYHEDN